VFYNPDAGRGYDNLKRSWGNALRKSYILDFRFHDLRHTFASWLVMAGVDIPTVQRLMGHKDIKMTLRYVNLAPAHIKNAILVLDKKITIGRKRGIS
jgi:integrase